jgi:two-component system response regulator (stage 0 sporulation protein F)
VDTINVSGNISGVEGNSRPLRILVVDDEALIRWSLVETLSDSGHQTVEAVDGLTALRAVRDASAPFDVVFLDFRLPDSSDLTLLSRLRQLAPTTQVILLTAYGTPEVVQGALDLGVFRVIGKPFEMGDVPALASQAHAARRSGTAA